MNKKNLLKLLFALMVIGAPVFGFAQPGGPGGRPMGPPPGGFNGRRPSASDMERMRRRMESERAAEKAQEVKQKRNVKEGDVFKVVGVLQDSATGEPVAFVNLAILDTADSALVKGSITDINGAFEIKGVPQGEYLLRVSAIGYKNFLIPITVSNNTALGTLKMQPGATTLKEVKIKAQRPLYAMDGEKLVYNVAEDPTVQTGTTSDALQNAPGVEVDIEGNITLRGVSSVEIWVNDKPSKFTAENLKTYLETLPANALDRIETITNPSAKYATSAEAVINIITSAYIKSNHFISFGVNGSLQPSVSPWVSYTWAKERLSINLFASGRYNYNENTGWNRTTYRRDGREAGQYDTTATEHYDSESNSSRLSGNIFANINYEIDTMTDISFFGSYNISQNNSFSALSRGRVNYLGTGRESFLYDDTNDNHGGSGFGMAGIDFTHKFDKNGHNIRAGIHENFSGGDSENDFIRLFSRPDSTYSLGQNYDKAYIDNNSRNSLSADVRYNRPYSENGEFSFGAGYGIDGTWRNYNVYDDFTTNKQFDYLRTYSFWDHEQHVEGDVEWTRRWGGFTLELGFGATYENIDFRYKGSDMYAFTNDDTVYNFLTYTPSLHLSYRTEDLHNFKLNYTLRMSHPGEEQLTTYKRYTLDSYSIGNRDLSFSYTHNAEAGWSKYFMDFGNVGLEGYARYSANEVDNLTSSTEEDDPVLNRIVQFSQPFNMGSSYRVGASANVMYRPSGFINVRLYANVFQYGYRLDQGAKGVLENSKLSYSIRLNTWAKVFDRYQIFASANYSSPTISLAAERKARYFLNFGVRADFFKRKMSAYINVQDIFNWGKTVGSGSLNTNPYLLSESNSYTLNSRYISAGITFRFGKMELERSSKSGSDDPSSSL